MDDSPVSSLSSLLRTVHRFIDYTPAHLPKTIFVEYYSDFNDLIRDLDNFLKHLAGYIEVIRNTKHEGLIPGKMIGAAHAEEVPEFLHSCEVDVTWLQPLLA